jgi:hypothetical protein
MQARRVTAVTAVATLLVAAGCGGTVQGTGVTDGTGSGGESQGGASGGVARNPRCSAGIPNDGATCSLEGTDCEYSTPSAPSYCTTRARCEQTTDGTLRWRVTPAPADCVVSRSECPGEMPGADGSECAVPPSVGCYYNGGRCDCVPPSPCSPAPTATWQCVPYARECPTQHPLWGDACPAGAKECGGYCGSSVGGELTCKDGYWASGGEAPCISCATQ